MMNLFLKLIICSKFAIFKSLKILFILNSQMTILSLIFFIFMGLYFYIKKTVIIKPLETREILINNNFEYFKYIEFWKMSNPKLTLLCVLVYFLNTFVLFAILRYIVLGYHTDLLTLSFNTLDIKSIILVILIYIFYMQIIQMITKKHLQILHIYLHYYIAEGSFGILNTFKLYYSVYFHTYIKFAHNELIQYKLVDIIGFFSLLKPKTKQAMYLINFFKMFISYIKNNIVYQLFKILPQTMLYGTLFYELYTRDFYYFKYALMFYLLTDFCSKIRAFYYKTNQDIDEMLSNYLYRESTEQEDMIISDDGLMYLNNEASKELLGENQYNVATREQIVDYLINDFEDPLPEYQSCKVADNDRNILLKRLQWLLFMFLGSVIFLKYFKDKYEIIVNLNEVQIYLSSSLIIAPTIIATVYIVYETYKKTNKKPKILFYRCCIIIQALLFMLVFYRNNYLLFPNEIILDLRYIQIIEEITLEDKIDLIKPYLKFYITEVFKLTIESKNFITNNLETNWLNQLELFKNISITQLQEFAENLVSQIYKNYIQQKYLSSVTNTAINTLSNVPEIFIFLKNGIAIFSITTLLTKTTFLLITIEEMWNNFPEFCYDIMKLFTKYWFR